MSSLRPNNMEGLPLLGALSDPFRHLKMALWGESVQSRTVVFSCCNHQEGASTIAFNFAAVLGREYGRRVLLIDGNLRRPALHQQLTADREIGLAELAQGTVELDAAIKWPTGHNFSFISAGRHLENPASIFDAPLFREVVAALQGRFDFIVFDSAPLLPYPDTFLLARELDGLMLVLEHERTKWEVARVVKGKLESAKVSIAGTILNKKKYHIPDAIYGLL